MKICEIVISSSLQRFLKEYCNDTLFILCLILIVLKETECMIITTLTLKIKVKVEKEEACVIRLEMFESMNCILTRRTASIDRSMLPHDYISKRTVLGWSAIFRANGSSYPAVFNLPLKLALFSGLRSAAD